MKLLFTAPWKSDFGIETHGKNEVVGERGKVREHLGSAPLEAALWQKEQGCGMKGKWYFSDGPRSES